MAIGRICLLVFVGGVGAVQLLPALPPRLQFGLTPPETLLMGLMFVAVLGAACCCRVRRSVASRTGTMRSPGAVNIGVATACITLFALTGFIYGAARAELRLSDALDPANEDKVTRVVLRVAELPRLGSESRLFVADVLSSVPDGVPSRIQVRWNSTRYSGPYGPRAGKPPEAFPEIVPGQVWRMALVLRKPHGARNPGGFDYEGHVFAQGIRASGTVRGTPVLLGDEPWAGLAIAAQRARHVVREAMLPHIGELRWGGVLLALAIGDQASVGPNDWITFNRSGLTHLVSISGSHVTMIAALAGMLVNVLWRRLRWRGRVLAERLPAQLAAATVALVVAWLYCLLAGWGVPARRTFVMLAVLAVSLSLRVPLQPTHVLALAAFAVVLLDPWSLLSSGFWLSFLAVYVLMASTGWWGSETAAPQTALRRGWLGVLHAAARLQLAITLALLPVLALLFSEISLVSPLANAYAIPVIGLLVTPLALLLAGLSLVPGAEGAAGGLAVVAHGLLQVCMWPTQWLAALPGASVPVAAAPWWATAFALVGVAIALLPRGFPYRSMGWAFMLPVLTWVPPRPAPGDWALHALDVGQGSAVVVQTARHVVVFDTGARYSPDADAAQRVVVPFLRSRGLHRVDMLVVSHGDMDHVGGTRSLLDALPVQQAYASFDLEAWLVHETRTLVQRAPAVGRQQLTDAGSSGPGTSVISQPPLPRAVNACAYSDLGVADGVKFQFLWPLESGHLDLRAGSRDRNRRSCVLRVQGAHHAVLLPGDIGADEEHALVERGLYGADVVLAAHHGSRHSSAQAFVTTLQAQHAVAQAARWNRYGHPAAAVRRRWQAHGASFWETGRHGAVTVRSQGGELSVHAERLRRPRYWSPGGGID